MLYTTAKKLSDMLFKGRQISEEDLEVYIYGFELLISTLSSLLSTLLFSIVFNFLNCWVAFMFFFFTVRLFSGGYHEKTFSRCFITTNAVFILICCLYSVLIKNDESLKIAIFLFFISVIFISIVSPIKNKKSSGYSKEKQKRINITLISLLIIQFIIVFVLYTYSYIEWVLPSIISNMMVTCFILIEFFERRKAKYEYD